MRFLLLVLFYFSIDTLCAQFGGANIVPPKKIIKEATEQSELIIIARIDTISSIGFMFKAKATIEGTLKGRFTRDTITYFFFAENFPAI